MRIDNRPPSIELPRDRSDDVTHDLAKDFLMNALAFWMPIMSQEHKERVQPFIPDAVKNKNYAQLCRINGDSPLDVLSNKQLYDLLIAFSQTHPNLRVTASQYAKRFEELGFVPPKFGYSEDDIFER